MSLIKSNLHNQMILKDKLIDDIISVTTKFAILNSNLSDEVIDELEDELCDVICRNLKGE